MPRLRDDDSAIGMQPWLERMHFLHWRNVLTKGRRGRNTTIQYHKGISWFISRLTEQALQSCRPQTCSRCIFLQLVRSFSCAYLFEYMLFKLSRLAPFLSSAHRHYPFLFSAPSVASPVFVVECTYSESIIESNEACRRNLTNPSTESGISILRGRKRLSTIWCLVYFQLLCMGAYSSISKAPCLQVRHTVTIMKSGRQTQEFWACSETYPLLCTLPSSSQRAR